ncbi:MAG: FAD-dependent oxidoreductase [Coriobacteriia bacterium]|nr:FAD-dependent oxidoreductase [Coriobacteriia bacterium]
MTAAPPVREIAIAIVGGGPAGLAAGLYAARALRSTVMFEGGVLGGQIATTDAVENYPGFPDGVNGLDLSIAMQQQAERFGMETVYARVAGIRRAEDGRFALSTEGAGDFLARAVIYTAGAEYNKLGVPRESELTGRGVSYCATCDAAFFKDADVAVVGPGESAADAALELATLGARVTLISLQTPKVPEAMMERVTSAPNIALLTGFKVTEIVGDTRVTGVKVMNPKEGTEQTVPVTGIFIESGSIAVSEFTAGLVEMNEKGEIVIDNRGATSAAGIYAAGDVTDTPGKQIIIAAGEGARAAMALSRDLKRR